MSTRSKLLLATAVAVGLNLAPAFADGIINGGSSGGVPSGAAGGDLSGSYPNPGVAKISGTTPATGVPTALGTAPNTSGGFVTLGAQLAGTPTDPTSTTSTSGVMMGLGSTCVIIPRSTGRIRIQFFYNGSNSTANDGFFSLIRYGTGTAPTNTAGTTPPTGNTAGSEMVFGAVPTANGFFNSTNGAIATGLTPGTTYWLDLEAGAQGGGSASIHTINCIAYEF